MKQDQVAGSPINLVKNNSRGLVPSLAVQPQPGFKNHVPIAVRRTFHPGKMSGLFKAQPQGGIPGFTPLSGPLHKAGVTGVFRLNRVVQKPRFLNNNRFKTTSKRVLPGLEKSASQNSSRISFGAFRPRRRTSRRKKSAEYVLKNRS
jgi:hypothetical protein